ncbi:capsular polysaccharide biosynthesis protein [Roseinatronobacter sp. S2]|uniref:capsular polysaccharide biosynthesis protein n=1 Tax=Roseinatronobacter sp. S2 TaxID=3035471 RepID=UPI00240EFD7F|nr:capsular polysaccharide biosynthesis protein [Roseinatronobacter sp. S2]WFE73253.1 capsular polysaccharide biosynthesis protein [Roseinatronobacter sp. S2]
MRAFGPQDIHAFSGGFLGPRPAARRIRKIMGLAGLRVRLGWPDSTGIVAVWGHAPRATRGEGVARRTGASLIRIEDAFLRSLFPGRMGEPPIGLLIDRSGVHYDPSRPSDLETLLATHPFDDHALIERARRGMARMKTLGLCKYAAHDPDAALPPPGYVLVVDQVRDDAALRHGGLSGAVPDHVFREMLVQAQLDHPGARIIIKTHPETARGLRRGYFGPLDCTSPNITLMDSMPSGWALLDGAIAVYTVSSQLGFEAIFAGHRPHVFGLPFYAGWGLTQDQIPHPRRRRILTRAQLFAGAMLLYPTWYDPCRDCLCQFEDVADHLEALIRAWREDHRGYVALHMRLWKRPHLQAFFGRWTRLHFARHISRHKGNTARRVMVWGTTPAPDGPVTRVEDGFLRSRGLGAELTPPLSLIADDMGLYYDPRTPSRLEQLLSRPLPAGGEARALTLIAAIRKAALSKYNLKGTTPALPDGHRILVPGQVEDDASVRLGAGRIATNLALLREVRAHNPDAVIVYKPHPDVEAGLRPGALPADTALQFADMVLGRADPAWLLDQVQEVWTMTSTFGFEALLRGVPVTTTGAPFYAGWGLTRDLGDVPERRCARPTLAAFVHATLIDYPRYIDPLTGLPCPPELAVERLQGGGLPKAPALRMLAKLQGLLASRAHLWR